MPRLAAALLMAGHDHHAYLAARIRRPRSRRLRRRRLRLRRRGLRELGGRRRIERHGGIVRRRLRPGRGLLRRRRPHRCVRDRVGHPEGHDVEPERLPRLSREKNKIAHAVIEHARSSDKTLAALTVSQSDRRAMRACAPRASSSATTSPPRRSVTPRGASSGTPARARRSRRRRRCRRGCREAASPGIRPERPRRRR